MVWYGMVRYITPQCGAVRCGAVRCGAVRCGAVRCGAVRCSVHIIYNTVLSLLIQIIPYLFADTLVKNLYRFT